MRDPLKALEGAGKVRVLKLTPCYLHRESARGHLYGLLPLAPCTHPPDTPGLEPEGEVFHFSPNKCTTIESWHELSRVSQTPRVKGLRPQQDRPASDAMQRGSLGHLHD